MRKTTAQGFTLVELLVVIAIIAILAIVVFLVVNPLEIQKTTRDSARLADLGSIQSAIGIAVQDATASGANLLCSGGSVPCVGRSTDANSQKIDGTGWAKIDISANKNLNLAKLPIDPLNTSAEHYTYCSDGNNYEIDAVLESAKNAATMQNDGGDENDNNGTEKYEAGTSLTLINPSGSCTY